MRAETEPKDDLSIGPSRLKPSEYKNQRPILASNLPFCFKGATPPRPCPAHPPSLVAAVLKRFGCKTPDFDRAMMLRFRRFVGLWLRHNVKPLDPIEIPSFDEWLGSTCYSAGRKAQLENLWNSAHRSLSKKKAHSVKSFVKDETYPLYKLLRLINSRSDEAKCYFGPVVAAVSAKLFSLDWFIKQIPVSERPKALRDKLISTMGPDNDDFIFTDYTAFEAHFIEPIMKVTSYQLFSHMLRNAGFRSQWMNMYRYSVMGRNKVQFKNLGVGINATRMSGEMDTSLSNGFANLMFFLFLVRENGGVATGFVEGDDGIFRVTPASACPTKEQFERLGLTIKIGHTKHLAEASFCGQVYSMDDLVVVADPLETLTRVGWTNKRYVHCNYTTRLGLLRARAYSLVHQYNGAPMLAALGYRLLELTRGTKIRRSIVETEDEWHRRRLVAALSVGIPPPKQVGAATRALVEKLYGVSVQQQIDFEQKCSVLELGMHGLEGLPVPGDWVHYFKTYSTYSPDPNPIWLDRSETRLLRDLSAYQNTERFLRSLNGG